MAKILLVEDDPNIRTAAEFALTDAGYTIVTCDNGVDGLTNALSVKPDLILLDLMLPEMDGHTLLKKFRGQNNATPLIVLTAYSSEQEKIFCLDAGADDFIDKPFSINELLARIRANLRRSAISSHADGEQQQQYGDMIIDFALNTVSVKGLPVSLRNREYEILEVLAGNQGALVTRDDLIREVWNGKPPSTSATIDVHMHNLRKSLEADSDYQLIATEYAKGWRLRPSLKKPQP